MTASSLQTQGHRRSNSRPFSILAPRHDPQKSLNPIDPTAKHYQDPEARLKLRVYLASPQKFDEAIEFGFPSLAKEKENIPPSTPVGRTFLDDDDTSDFNHEEPINCDNESIASSNAPYTPVEPGTASRKTSKDINHEPVGSVRPRVIHKVSESYAKSSAGDREMTLHMTLTRPDLRTTGSDITKPANNDDADALKLEDLPLSDENHLIWSTMPPVEKNKVKKVWNKLRGKN
ncbi:hypothetical protein UCRPC4_g02229 [Phaeomoniella chlamydospora]|uniref:Uncharacterized protein n=1 Tax=Phaeomoniella chlamydospora TaxID=158046 RepID=A0A0G2GNE3_PHACM|nr:hypothetical protein UCRPC4_g02229 [Phaeomoniella chlamydospora]